MDPAETLRIARDAYTSGDFETCREYLGYYSEWRRKGGFEPPDGDKIFNELLSSPQIDFTI